MLRDDSQTPPINQLAADHLRRHAPGTSRRWAQLPLEEILKALQERGDLSLQLGTVPARLS